jgi:hypothetical protein
LTRHHTQPDTVLAIQAEQRLLHRTAMKISFAEWSARE